MGCSVLKHVYLMWVSTRELSYHALELMGTGFNLYVRKHLTMVDASPNHAAIAHMPAYKI